MIFKIALRLTDRNIFLGTYDSGVFERFHYFHFEESCLKNNFFYGKPEYSFLVESTMMKNRTFSYKTSLSKANVKPKSLFAQMCEPYF